MDKSRVDKANLVYDNALKLVLLAHARQAFCIIENPARSWLWSIPEFDALLRQGFVDVDFQHCKFSPESPEMRPKWTRFRTNCKRFLGMSGPCSLDHTHIRWGRNSAGEFNTKHEAEYPDGLCREAAAIIAEELLSAGCDIRPVALDPDMASSKPHKRRRAVLGKQPQGKQLPPLLPEFLEVKRMTHAEAVERHAKILRTIPSSPQAANGVQHVYAGIYRDPVQYMEMAVEKAAHPVDLQGAIPDELAKLVFDNFVYFTC